MIDLGGLDLDLTYEDGLRLSELLGTRAELAYGLDHVWMHSIVVIIFLTILLVAVWVLATALVHDSMDRTFFGRKVFEYDEDYDTFEPKRMWLYRSKVEERRTSDQVMYEPYTGSHVRRSFAYKNAVYTLSRARVAAVLLIPFVVLIVLMAVLIVTWNEYDLSGQLAGVDAQIEELVSRYV